MKNSKMDLEGSNQFVETIHSDNPEMIEKLQKGVAECAEKGQTLRTARVFETTTTMNFAILTLLRLFQSMAYRTSAKCPIPSSTVSWINTRKFEERNVL